MDSVCVTNDSFSISAECNWFFFFFFLSLCCFVLQFLFIYYYYYIIFHLGCFTCRHSNPIMFPQTKITHRDSKCAWYIIHIQSCSKAFHNWMIYVTAGRWASVSFVFYTRPFPCSCLVALGRDVSGNTLTWWFLFLWLVTVAVWGTNFKKIICLQFWVLGYYLYGNYDKDGWYCFAVFVVDEWWLREPYFH